MSLHTRIAGTCWVSSSAQAGDHRAAVEFIDRAVDLRPDWAEAHANLGIALHALGESRTAVRALERVLELKPDFAVAQNNLGNALEGLGKLDQAVACYRRIVELNPDHATAFNRLGNALVALKKPDEAVVCYRRTVELKPDSAQAHFNLGIALSQLGEHEEALACYRRALELKPDFAEAHNNVGNVFKDLGDLDAALACYRMAIVVNDGFAMAHSNAGNALKGQGKLSEAIGYYRRALELDPDFAEAWNNLGNAHRECGSLDEALACYRRALALRPDYVTAHSNLLDTLHYCPEVTPATLAEAHIDFDRVHTAPLYGALAHAQGTRGFRDRLRLGFVSPDLGQHPVGYFLVRVLENLGHEGLDLICYSDRLVGDRLTNRLRAAATGRREVSALSDDGLTTQIKRDEIDILFDLAGHTARNRLLVFARKPARIQVSWIGYEGTTGLAVMDYLIVDQWMVPRGSEHHYREKLVRMPDGYLCFDPPADAPSALPPPSLERGFATFGSFNNLAKITPEVVAVWSKLLRALPTARTDHEVSTARGSWRTRAVPRIFRRQRRCARPA